MDPKEPVSQLRVNSSVFVFATAATPCRIEKSKQLWDEDATVYSSETHSMFRQRPKERRRCKPTAMMRHRIWLKSLSPNTNNQPTSSLQTEEGQELSQLANQSVQQPTKDIIRLILNKNKIKKSQNSRQGSSQITLKTKTNKLR